MKTEVVMPQMGESVAEGTITKWYKKVGDKVVKDEPLFEISTDKVDAEVPSPADGYLAEIKVKETETVPVETVVALISEAPPASPTISEPPSAPEQESAPTSLPAKIQAKATDSLPDKAELRRTRSSPLVRKIAAEHGIDISRIKGSGLSGRVTKRDILSYIEEHRSDSTASIQPTSPRGTASPVTTTIPSKFTYSPKPSDKAEPFSPMRRQIAEHMVISRNTSVHVTTVFEVDMTRVVKLRNTHQDQYASKGVRLTFLPFIMKAVIEGIRRYPVLNASVVDETIYYKQEINLGIAVALDWGLLVPVIKRADEKSLLGLAKELQDKAERARAKRLSPDEVQDGTFTITNPGVFGSLFGTPIINQPQVAILGVGTITKRPVVTEDDAIAIRHMMYLALSFDHRVIDGATADRFMSTLKLFLQEFPEGML